MTVPTLTWVRRPQPVEFKSPFGDFEALVEVMSVESLKATKRDEYEIFVRPESERLVRVIHAEEFLEAAAKDRSLEIFGSDVDYLQQIGLFRRKDLVEWTGLNESSWSQIVSGNKKIQNAPRKALLPKLLAHLGAEAAKIRAQLLRPVDAGFLELFGRLSAAPTRPHSLTRKVELPPQNPIEGIYLDGEDCAEPDEYGVAA